VPIIDMQRRMRQLGEIRIGHVVDTGRISERTGKPILRPEKLDKFRFTSASKPLLEQIAQLYGGAVQEWTPANGGPKEWEVYSEVDRVPVIVPPMNNVIDSWFEQYKGSKCARRCDGQVEQKSDQPCICRANWGDNWREAAPARERCQITTRLNVMLRDVRGLGVWLLTTHGFYASSELPAMAETLLRARGEIPGFLTMEEKVVPLEDGGTARFMVPKLDVDLTPGELFAGAAKAAVSAGQAPAVAGGGRPALESGAPRDFLADIAAASSRDEVLALWRAARDARVSNGAEIEAAAKARVDELAAGADQDAAEQAAAESSSPPGEPAPDPEQTWQHLVQNCPQGWTVTALENAFAERYQGVHPSTATGEQMAEFAEVVTGGWLKPPADANGAPF
jgi:Recombination directionality factor-like